MGERNSGKLIINFRHLINLLDMEAVAIPKYRADHSMAPKKVSKDRMVQHWMGINININVDGHGLAVLDPYEIGPLDCQFAIQ